MVEDVWGWFQSCVYLITDKDEAIKLIRKTEEKVQVSHVRM